jgi:hypothetical protein
MTSSVIKKRIVPALLMLALSAMPAPAGASVEITEVGKQPVEADFPSGGRLRMDLCSSEVNVRGTEGSGIRLLYDSETDTSRVRVRIKSTGGDGELEVEDCPHNNFRITIEVPRLTDLHLRMSAGQLGVKGVTGNKDLELHAGELDLEIGRREDYATVEASVTTGEVDAAPFDTSKGGLFRSFEWKGPGKYRLHAHTGAGQVTLTEAAR